MVLILPIYLVVFRARFWFALFAAWFFLCAAESYQLDRKWALYEEGQKVPGDYTNIGILIFSGWIFALPYCLILVLVRKILQRYNLVRLPQGEQAGDGMPDHASS